MSFQQNWKWFLCRKVVFPFFLLAIKSGYLIPAFSGGQKTADMPCHPYSIGGPPRQAREENERWLLHPCLLGIQNIVEMLNYPYILEGPQTRRGNEIRSGYLTRVFLEAQKRAEVLRHAYLLGGPQRRARGQNQKSLLHLCLLGGKKRAEVLRHFRVSPTPSAWGEHTWLPHQWVLGALKTAEMLHHPYILGIRTPKPGSKSEVAMSPLPSRGPKRGRRCSSLCILRGP